MRTAIKTKCEHPVTYAIAMRKDDWLHNIQFVYPDVPMNECEAVKDQPEVIECMVHLSKEHPATGWQMRDGVYGIHSAHRIVVETSQQQKPAVQQLVTPQPKAAAN